MGSRLGVGAGGNQSSGSSSHNVHLNGRTHCHNWKFTQVAVEKKKNPGRKIHWSYKIQKYHSQSKNISATNLWRLGQSMWETLLGACPILKLLQFYYHSWSETRFGATWTRDLSWYSFRMVLLSCANQFKVNYLRDCAWNLSFCTESYAGAAYCSASLLKILLFKKTQYENESPRLLKRPTVHSLIASRELSLIWRRFCLFQVLCQSLTYTTFPTPKKIHKSAQQPPKYKFNREKSFACFVFQLKVFVILVLISLHNRKLSCMNAALALHQRCIQVHIYPHV